MQRKPERISSLSVERGLYVLRYLSAAGSDHPVIFVRPSPGDDSGLTVVPFPGEPMDRMTNPGALMVLVVPQAGTMQITAQASSASGSLNAELRLEPLKPGMAIETDAPATGMAAEIVPIAPPRNEGFSPAQAGAVVQQVGAPVIPMGQVHRLAPVLASTGGRDGLRLIAHVSRRGDVLDTEGNWIGGPDAPAPIEGLAVECPAALGEVQCQVLATGDTRWSEWIASGAFGGSRGRAMPLVGLRFRLLPAAGVEATMEGEALFLGSAIVRKDGQDLEFRSAAGLDPLLGIKLKIKRETTKPVSPPSLVSTVPQSGRVRVFRASGRRSF